jgi:hypothetical protein
MRADNASAMRTGSANALEKLARLGFAAQGVVYVTMGLLAAGIPLGRNPGTTDPQDAIAFLRWKPLGQPLLAAMVFGLLGYAVWSVCSGIFDSEHRGRDVKGIVIRIGEIILGLVYAILALALIRWLLHHGGGSGGDAASQHWTSRVMDHPFGRWAVGLAGAAIISYGVYEIYCAAVGKLGDQLHVPNKLLIGISRFGIAARAVILGVIGFSLTRAAIRYDSSAARGTSGALNNIAARPFGVWLLIVVGFGLVAYGIFAFVNARYRRIALT